MKKLFLLPLFAAAFALFSCNDAALKPIDNIAMISEASNGQTTQKFRIDWWTDESNSTFTKTLTCRLGNKATEEVTFSVELDEDYLALYNEQNGTNYELPPAENYNFPSEVTVGVGEIQANIEIAVTKLREKFIGETDDEVGTAVPYAIPIRVTSTTDGLKLPTRTSRYIYFLDFEAEPYVPPGPLTQQVPTFTGKNAMISGDWDEKDWLLPTYTVEFLANVKSFPINNQVPCSSKGSIDLGDGKSTGGFYIRYGDAAHGTNKQTTGQYSWFQIKYMGENGDVLRSYNLENDTWYHWAITWDGNSLGEGTGECKLYRNGEWQATLESSGVFGAKGMNVLNQTVKEMKMCQFRVWRTVRSVDEIKMYMWQEIPKKQFKDLVVYWPMNDGSGEILKDATGKGCDLHIGQEPDGNGGWKLRDGGSKTATWSTITFDNRQKGVIGVEPAQ